MCLSCSSFRNILVRVIHANLFANPSGGTKQLIRMSSGKIVVGGLPDIAPNTTIVDKVVQQSVNDRRYRRSAGTILGVTTDGRAVKSVSGDMQGLRLLTIVLL